MPRCAHHSAAAPQQGCLDKGSRQNDEMGRAGGLQRSRRPYLLPQRQLRHRPASLSSPASHRHKATNPNRQEVIGGVAKQSYRIQLRFRIVERAMGIEPTSEAWEASILPLYDARSSLTA